MINHDLPELHVEALARRLRRSPHEIRQIVAPLFKDGGKPTTAELLATFGGRKYSAINANDAGFSNGESE